MTQFVKQLKNNLITKDPIIGKDRYKISGVLLPVVKIDEQWHLVFQVRAKHIRQGGEVCFPGGKFDADIDVNTKDTAIRETIEEMGISEENLEYIGKLGHYIAPMGVLVDAYVGQLHISDVNELEYNRNEVERVFTKSIEELKQQPPQIYNVAISVDPYSEKNGKKELLLPYEELGLPERYKKPWGNINHRIFVWENDPVIWGITAELIKDFLDTI